MILTYRVHDITHEKERATPSPADLLREHERAMPFSRHDRAARLQFLAWGTLPEPHARGAWLTYSEVPFFGAIRDSGFASTFIGYENARTENNSHNDVVFV